MTFCILDVDMEMGGSSKNKIKTREFAYMDSLMVDKTVYELKSLATLVTVTRVIVARYVVFHEVHLL